MTPLAKKLHLKPGYHALVINAPAEYLAALMPLPEKVAISEHAIEGTTYPFVQLFVKNSHELKQELEWLVPYLTPGTVFWITYPKKSSGISSDLEMMRNWDELSNYNYSGVAAAAINEVWTALRWKPSELVKSDEACNDNIPTNLYGDYIDVQNREIILPGELQTALAEHPGALTFFQGLSFTNRKEYVVWILSAKQETTKAMRLTKTVEKLIAGKKNPSEK